MDEITAKETTGLEVMEFIVRYSGRKKASQITKHKEVERDS